MIDDEVIEYSFGKKQPFIFKLQNQFFERLSPFEKVIFAILR